MRFKGQLLLPTERGPGLRVDLEIADHHLAVVSDQEELGAWPLEAIQARRLRGDTFAMTVAGEDLHFVADDTISFAYTGIPAIERVAGLSQTHSLLRNLLGLFRDGPTKGSHDQAVTTPNSPATIGKSPWSRTDELSPPIHGPDETEVTQHHDRPSRLGVAEPQPEVAIPAPSAPPPSRMPTDESTDQSESEDPTQDPIIDMTGRRVLDEEWGRTPPEAAVDRSTGTELIEHLDRHQPVGHVPTPGEAETPGCPTLRSDGLPCQSPILGPSGYCYSHDPERPVGQGFRKAQEARSRLKRKGATRLTRVYARLDKALRQVERGELDPAKAMAMAQLARTMCAILELDDQPEVDTREGSPPAT